MNTKRTIRRTAAAVLALAAALAVPAHLWAHGGHEHVMGTVKEVKGDQLAVTTREGKAVAVQLTPQTRYLKGKASAALADLKPGTRVVIDTGEQDGHTVAVEVRLGAPAPAKAAPAATAPKH